MSLQNAVNSGCLRKTCTDMDQPYIERSACMRVKLTVLVRVVSVSIFKKKKKRKYILKFCTNLDHPTVSVTYENLVNINGNTESL